MTKFIKMVLVLVVSLLPISCAPDSEAASTSWSVKTVTMESGRKYFVYLPNDRVVRQLVIYSHGANAPEDVFQAGIKLKELHKHATNTVFAYSVSKGGTKKFDVGINYCCTWVDTQEVPYLIDVRNSVSALVPIDQSEVKVMGVSNGGMLSERAACVRPDVFSAAGSWAGTWESDPEGCRRGIVNIQQWHGTKDTTVPINGGTKYLWGKTIVVPPADEMYSKILPKSHYKLIPKQGEDHVASGEIIGEMTRWVVTQ